jgi:hypothetical protein
MAHLNPGRFAFGLIAEIAGILLIVTVLPRIPWEAASLNGPPEVVADQRPSLVIPAVTEASQRRIWRGAVEKELEPASIPPVDPVYVERRLDRAGQQLLSGVSTYVVETARQVLESPEATAEAIAPTPPIRPFPPSFVAPGSQANEGNWRY